MTAAAAGTKPNSDGAQADKGGQPDAAATAAAAAAATAAADKATADQPAADKATADAAAAAAADKDKKKDEPPARVVPDKYELKLPDAARVSPSEAKEIERLAKREKWTNEEAQQHLEAIHQGRLEQSTQFLQELNADADYGGDKLGETQRLATLALDRIRPKGTPRGDALRTLLVNEGLGNNLHVTSLLADIGKLMDEDKPLAGLKPRQPVGDQGKELGSKLYNHPDSVKINEQTTR